MNKLDLGSNQGCSAHALAGLAPGRADHRRPKPVEDQPTVTYPDGHREWHQHGQYHRVGGPAVIYPDGSQWWFLHGRRHRADGPAVIRPDGTQSWYVQGCDITAEVLAWLRDNDVTWPFTESQQTEFALRWL